MQAILDTLAFVRRWVQPLGPYLLLELLMPGGSLLALGLFLYRNGKLGAASLKFVRVPAKLSATAKAAAFLVSDRTRMITGPSAGAVLD
jgi:hypothetical protein